MKLEDFLIERLNAKGESKGFFLICWAAAQRLSYVWAESDMTQEDKLFPASVSMKRFLSGGTLFLGTERFEYDQPEICFFDSTTCQL